MFTRDDHSESVRLAIFESKRKEIEYRTNAQHTLITLNLTAIAAIGGFAMAKEGDHRLLLLFTILCPAIGMLWLDHANTIDNIGDYIRENLEIDKQWETDIENQRKKWLGSVNYGAQILILFGGPAVGALIEFYVSHRASAGNLSPRYFTSWLFYVGLGLLVWFLGNWYYLFIHRYRSDRIKELMEFLKQIRTKLFRANKDKGHHLDNK